MRLALALFLAVPLWASLVTTTTTYVGYGDLDVNGNPNPISFDIPQSTLPIVSISWELQDRITSYFEYGNWNSIPLDAAFTWTDGITSPAIGLNTSASESQNGTLPPNQRYTGTAPGAFDVTGSVSDLTPFEGSGSYALVLQPFDSGFGQDPNVFGLWSDLGEMNTEVWLMWTEVVDPVDPVPEPRWGAAVLVLSLGLVNDLRRRAY